MKKKLCAWLLCLQTSSWLGSPSAAPAAAGDGWAPPAVRAPSGLIGDAADRTLLLEWNANLEEELAGYRVYRNGKPITQGLAAATEFVDRDLTNGEPCDYYVAAVLKEGRESAHSNMLRMAARAVIAPQVHEGAVDVDVPGLDSIHVNKAVTVAFENGHQIIFDEELGRVRDWQTREGVHLIYPQPYGNPIDLTELDEFGLPQSRPATRERPALGPAINLDYAGRKGQAAVSWVGATAADGRITFQYRIPLTGPGLPPGTTHDVWVWATVWETWSAASRTLGDLTWQGLARKIEIDVPSYYKEGYSFCPNDGFGVNGSCDKAVTYELRWSGREENYLAETHWEKGKDGKGTGQPRSSRGFHPTQNATQVSPFLLADFPQGSLILAPRRYEYATTYAWRNYAEEGRDGLWPNYSVDVSASGRRVPVETFEYLWTSNTNLPLPQKFIDASFYYRRQLADLYQLNRNLPCMDYAWDYWGPGAGAVKGKSEEEALNILRDWGKQNAAKAKAAGADMLGGAHELWTSSPYTVPDAIRLDPEHAINRAIADTVRAFADKGIRFGYWVRPEFVKQALPNVLSDHFWTPYYGYAMQTFPPAIPIMERDGLPLIRQHPEWIRLGRNGDHPLRTPYNWTPMCLTRKGWYEEVVYKSPVMMQKLGMRSALQDGGFSALTGVDRTGGQARPIQPYYWRFYQDLARLGIDLDGECMTGWASNNLGTPRPEDMKNLWALALATYRGNRDGNTLRWHTAEMRHKSHQLYSACYLNLESGLEVAKAAHFAQEFLREHGDPDRVWLEGLHWDGQQKEWVWENVWWEYQSSKRVRQRNLPRISAKMSALTLRAPVRSTGPWPLAPAGSRR